MHSTGCVNNHAPPFFLRQPSAADSSESTPRETRTHPSRIGPAPWCDYSRITRELLAEITRYVFLEFLRVCSLHEGSRSRLSYWSIALVIDRKTRTCIREIHRENRVVRCSNVVRDFWPNLTRFVGEEERNSSGKSERKSSQPCVYSRQEVRSAAALALSRRLQLFRAESWAGLAGFHAGGHVGRPFHTETRSLAASTHFRFSKDDLSIF